MGRVVVNGAGESVVVEGLSVVRVGAGFEKQPGEFESLGMRRLVGFATTERSCERGEGWHEAVPQEPGMGVRAGVQL